MSRHCWGAAGMSSWVHSSHWGEKTLDAGLCWPGSPLPGPRVASLPKKQAGPDYGAQDRKYVLLLFRIVSGWSENTINLVLKFVESGQTMSTIVYLASDWN